MTSLKCKKVKHIIIGIIFLLLAGSCGLLFSYSMFVAKFCMHLCFFFIPFGCVFLLVSVWFLGNGCTLTEDDMIEMTDSPRIHETLVN